MRRLGMPVSDDTILRQLERDAALVSCDATIRVVGIDDWSWRRSWRHGTMIVDLERRSVVDILDDRSVPSVARWLNLAAPAFHTTRKRGTDIDTEGSESAMVY